MYWMSIAIVGVVVGLSIQFVRAWAPPTGSAPNGTVSAPILTIGGQRINGRLTVNELCFVDSTNCRTTWATTGTGSIYTPGEWFNDKLVIDYAEGASNWATLQEVSFTAPHAINKVRVRGYSDDGGYCYAYWGTGNIETYRHDGKHGYYNVDMQSYQGYWAHDMYGANPECAIGAPLQCDDSGNCYCWVENNCPTYPPTFSNDGTAKICQIQYEAGSMADAIKDASIPEGAVVKLQGRHVDGPGSGQINCSFDIQYAP